ncbi:MAG TPA: hypothetical protein VFX27_04225, partial [Sphingobium sp.]|nr:hypothetical protein [Sphingobium sp.]
MTEPQEPSNLPAQIGEEIAAVPKALVPASLKALDRLVGAAVDIPVAWLAQKKAKIDAQTQAYTLVEASIAKAAAAEAGADKETIQRAVDVLVRKSYRKQLNREAVATAMLADLTANTEHVTFESSGNLGGPDEDWLNVFERYAE